MSKTLTKLELEAEKKCLEDRFDWLQSCRTSYLEMLKRREAHAKEMGKVAVTPEDKFRVFESSQIVNSLKYTDRDLEIVNLMLAETRIKISSTIHKIKSKEYLWA